MGCVLRTTKVQYLAYTFVSQTKHLDNLYGYTAGDDMAFYSFGCLYYLHCWQSKDKQMPENHTHGKDTWADTAAFRYLIFNDGMASSIHDEPNVSFDIPDFDIGFIRGKNAVDYCSRNDS